MIKRVRAGTECAIGEEQCGFRQGRRCMDYNDLDFSKEWMSYVWPEGC